MWLSISCFLVPMSENEVVMATAEAADDAVDLGRTWPIWKTFDNERGRRTIDAGVVHTSEHYCWCYECRVRRSPLKYHIGDCPCAECASARSFDDAYAAYCEDLEGEMLAFQQLEVMNENK